MAYRLNKYGDEVRQVVNEMQTRTPTATATSPGFLSASDKSKLDSLSQTEYATNYEILDIWTMA